MSDDIQREDRGSGIVMYRVRGGPSFSMRSEAEAYVEGERAATERMRPLLDEAASMSEAARIAACAVFGEQMGGGPSFYEVLREIANRWQAWKDAGGAERLFAEIGEPLPWSLEGRTRSTDAG